jgi:hypothetical protein
MRQKKLVIGLLVMLAVLVSGFTYAYWNTVVAPAYYTDFGTITIGQGNTYTTAVSVANVDDTSALVPTGYGSVGDDTAALSFTVNWTGAGAEGSAGTLSVSIDSYSFTGLTTAEIDAMFSITVTSGEGAIVVGTPGTVVVTVVFENEPATLALYNTVALGTLTVNLTFSVAV